MTITKRSTVLANLNSTPVRYGNEGLAGFKKRAFVGNVALAATDLAAVGDVVLMAKVPSNAIITALTWASDDLDSGTVLVVDVGFYKEDGTEYTTGSGDTILDGVATLQTATVETSIRFTTMGIETITQKAYELAGGTTDEGDYIYIGVLSTATAATQVAGDLIMLVEYCTSD